ncbi:unnamed protein product [Fraxinus pennsylvanica]|uniref:Uncharacterized protein n=1 Tax=Fraxinus pennsylvanica TaxID=56036 RepID=A0AAD1ZMZ3_9LAMI|nr:unnamed protein product [Fraxinus pennsylvanica]
MNWMRPSQYLDTNHSFGADGVFETEGNNHEEVARSIERETEAGKEAETWEIGREAMSVVMETVVGNNNGELVILEIGREAVTGCIEREIEAGGAVMETVVGGIEWEAETREIEMEIVVGNIERETNVVDIDVRTNVGTEMYTKVFTRKKINLNKTYQQTDALMRDKRLRKASKLVSSPYTTRAKWKRHVDNTNVDIFWDVDLVKKKYFSKWHSGLGDG